MGAARQLLVLGGTVFLGRHVVAAALAAGHRVTLFNRGRRAVAFGGPVEALVGDRDGDVAALRGRRFDAVIDCCAYRPAQLQRVADALGPVLPPWILVSSVSALAGFPPGRPYDETAPVTADTTGYGGEKARTEEALQALAGARATILRPGLIVGRHDPTGRFAWWPWRIARGGRVLAPGRPERPVQVIDVRDLAEWCVRLAEAPRPGVFHAVGPSLPMVALLEACRRASGSEAQWVWRRDAELLAAGVTPWTGLPLWIPEDDPQAGGLMLGRRERALAAGLGTRTIDDTVADVLAALREEPAAAVFPNVLSPEAEARLVADAPLS